MTERIRRSQTEAGGTDIPDPETIVAEIDERLLLGESHQYSLQEVKAYFESERCKQMTRLTFRMPGPPVSPYDFLPKNTAWVNTFS